jgi:hypothetical protein
MSQSILIQALYREPGSAISVMSRLRAGRFGPRIPVDARDFSLLQRVKNVSVTHQAPTRWISYFVLRAKWPEPTVDHLYPRDARFKCERK